MQVDTVGGLVGSADTAATLAKVRIALTYAWRHGRLPDFEYPRRFTEMVQWRKLHDRSPAQVAAMDKLAVKAMARDLLGSRWAIPTLWSGNDLPEQPPFPAPAIVKARHGCNQFAALRVTPDAPAWAALRRRARRWMARPYGVWLDEWAYRDVPRGILAEPLIGDGPELPVDYKIYVFGGQATHVQVHLGRGDRHRWILHDRDYTPLVATDDRPAAPISLNAMFEAAEVLAKGHDFLRVDFYEVAGQPLFGELCLYPGSGLDTFAADWIDFELGRLWLDAAGRTFGRHDLAQERPVRHVLR